MPCNTIRSEKDSNITLNIVKDPDKDGDNIDFVNVYGRPMYATRMQGKPFGLMRDGYPGETEQYFEVEHPYNGSEIVAPHKHNNPDDYSDDDFFEIHNQSVAFQQLMKNYTFLLKYTGRRWYGQIVDPSLSADSFKEEEYHAFWMNSFSGLGQEDNSTLIISEITSSVSPASGELVCAVHYFFLSDFCDLVILTLLVLTSFWYQLISSRCVGGTRCLRQEYMIMTTLSMVF